MLRVLDPGRRENIPPKRCALAIMTKAPIAGKVKTRLTPPLSSEEAARLNICFLRDLSMSILGACQMSPATAVAVYMPVGAEAVYENILSEECFLIPQRGENFGERLVLAAEDLLKLGFSSVCLINSDSPTVPSSSFAEAANELSKPGDPIVLGPAADGGYYLIGLQKLHRRLFEEIDWSTGHVFEQTRQRAREVGVEVHQLPLGLDVDDAATLGNLCEELFGPDARHGTSPSDWRARSTADVAPATRKFLSEIIEREGRERIWPAP